MTRLVRILALCIAGVLVVGGCGGIKERKERADRVIGSVDKAIAAKSAQMSVWTDIDVKLEGADRLAAGAAAGDTIRGSTFAAQADLRSGRAAYLAPGADGAAGAVRIYAGTTMYARRLDQSAPEPRPWVRLDLTSVDPDEIDNDEVAVTDALTRIRQIQGIENPLFLLHLLRGTLSGSVEEVGQESVGGVPTTHYRLNIDREKAVKDDDEDVQDVYEALFKSMFATRTVFPAEVWLDDEGLPRKYALTLKANVRRRSLADFRLTVELFDLGRPVQIVLPDKSETAKVESLGDLMQTVTGGA